MATKKDATEVQGEGGKKKGKLIILIVLLLLIAGGAGGGWYWWKYIKNAENAEENGAAKKKKKKNAGPVFVSLDAFTVNLQGEEGQLLQTAITLQLSDEEDAAKLKQHLPLVRSRLVMLLSSKNAQAILTTEGKVALAKEIAEQVKQPFYPNDSPVEIQNVLFTSFIVQ